MPCNTALCYITGSIPIFLWKIEILEEFPDRKSQIRGTVKARMTLWILSAIGLVFIKL